MKKYFLGIVTFLSITLLTSSAYSGAGISVILGEADTSGTESEKSGSVGPETNTKTIKESFVGGSLFIEGDLGPFTIGFDWVPLDIDLGSGKRTDTTSDSNESTDDSGTYSASADMENLLTLYVNYPIGPGYVLAGIHHADITTTEALPNSTYPNDSVSGYQIGYGIKGDRFAAEVFYSDFDDVSLTSTSGSSKITGDADVYGVKLKASFGG